MQRQVTCLLSKTIVDKHKTVIPLCKVRKGSVSQGKRGYESRGQVGLLLWNTKVLYTTALQLLTNLLSHVHCYALTWPVSILSTSIVMAEQLVIYNDKC
jgi:hypothetical protein